MKKKRKITRQSLIKTYLSLTHFYGDSRFGFDGKRVST